MFHHIETSQLICSAKAEAIKTLMNLVVINAHTYLNKLFLPQPTKETLEKHMKYAQR